MLEIIAWVLCIYFFFEFIEMIQDCADHYMRCKKCTCSKCEDFYCSSCDDNSLA